MHRAGCSPAVLPPTESLLHLRNLSSSATRAGLQCLMAFRLAGTWLQWSDEVRGIGMVTAVSILAHIGDIRRFPSADDLVSYAGLAPGHRQSDETCHHGKIGGGGTDSHLRYLIVESMQWVCQIPRCRAAFTRTEARRGTNIARIVVSRMLLRSIYKMLRDGVRFNQTPAA